MRSYGSDRVRESAGRLIIHSPIAKGWTPRTAKTLTSAEYPGTAVLWDDQYFEVVEAAALPNGGIRYVLLPWREEHTIRTVDRYDDESEAARRSDFELAHRQRRASVLASLSSIFLGHLPEPVQTKLHNELGVSPARMTVVSCLLGWAPAAICGWLAGSARLNQTGSPVPPWLALVVAFLSIESMVRFYVAMSQNRGMGSLFGWCAYLLYWRLSSDRTRLVSPFDSTKGESRLFMITPSDDVVLRDSLQMKGPLLALLPAAEQQKLAGKYGFDYRRHAYPLAWAGLVCGGAGVATSIRALSAYPTFSAFASLVAAGAIALEQLFRLIAFRRGPAGSMFAPLVRPFVRSLL